MTIAHDILDRRPVHPGGDCRCGSKFLAERTLMGYELCRRCGKLRPTKAKKGGLRRGSPIDTPRIRAVAYLRSYLTPEEKRELRELRQRLDRKTYLVEIHHGLGVRVRNALRVVGFDEKKLGVRNMDDIYVALLDRALGLAKQESGK